MKNAKAKRDAAIRQICADVIAQESPDEVFLVEGYDPANRHYGKTSRGPSGFGVEAGITLLLPFVWKLCEKIFEKISDEAASAIAKKASALFVTKSGATETNQAAVEELTAWAQGELEQNGVAKDRTAAVAKSFVEAFLKHKVAAT